MNSRARLLVVCSSICLMALLLLGAALGKTSSPEGPYRHLAVYTEVLSRIKSEYVEEPDLKSVTLGALNGLLESIDPFASYLNADQYKEWLKNRNAYKADVGLVLSKKFGYVGVVSALTGSPAAKAGLVTGDMLEAIKGVATRDMPLAYADLLLHGEPGSTIEVSVLRIRRPEPQKITLTRAVTAYPPVSSKLMSGQVGYLRPETLASGKVKEVAAAVSDLQKQGAQKLVLDLRQCALGMPEDGVALANLFLDKGLITYLQGQRFPRQNFAPDAAKALWKGPLALIINRGTAGPAEVAAAALLDNKRAELVGERTYGDASVRKPITTDDGGAIILSVAKYYSPNGKAIQDTGVTPQTLLSEPEAGSDPEDDNDAPTPEPQRKSGEDALLNKAIEVLKSK